jgi:hypothetical protein
VDAIKAHKTTAQMFGVHPTQLGGWKKQALAGLPDMFSNGREQMREHAEAERDELYKQIGQLEVELEFLKKELDLSIEERRRWIDPQHPHLSVQRQCELLGVPRSTYYYEPRGRLKIGLRDKIPHTSVGQTQVTRRTPVPHEKPANANARRDWPSLYGGRRRVLTRFRRWRKF